MPAPTRRPTSPQRLSQQGESLADLRQRLRIDKHSMDRECEEHPDLFDKVAQAVAMAQSRRDEAINSLRELESDLAAEFKEAAEKRKERISEAAIKRMVQGEDDVRNMRMTVLRLKERAAVLEGLKESYKQRSYMLTNLTELAKSGYYSLNVGQGRRTETDDDRSSRPRVDRR